MEVYFALNRINGKAYVGWTKHTAPIRFRRHCSNAKAASQFYFHKAIRKYGADAFDVLTVWKGDDAEEMKQVEKNYIAGMKTNDPQRGYNLTSGGEGIVGLKHSEDTKRKMVENRLPMTDECRQAHRENMRRLWADPSFRSKRHGGLFGHGVSDAGRKNMSSAQKGHDVSVQQRAKLRAANLGKRHTDETKTKMSVAMKTYLATNPRTDTSLSKFQAAGADALRGKQWTAARREAHERRVAIRAK